jgi:hypothetical protein
MIREIAEGAYRLDHWLKLRIGRLYTTVLSIGLVGGIIASARTLFHTVGSPQNLAALAVTVVFQVALLINQLGQLHEYREAIRARREARRRARGGAAPSPGDPTSDP